MSGPTLGEQVHRRDATNLERRHIKNLRSLADKVERKDGLFRTETRRDYPDLTSERRQAIAALLRAKADVLEAHMNAIDTAMSDEFSTLVRAVEWCSTGDYGAGRVADAWEDYDAV